MGKFDICDIPVSTITTGLEGKIIGLFGTNNVGKSYVAARLFPGNTLWLATEKGYNAQGGLRPYDIENWNDFRDAVAQLTTRNKEKRKKVRDIYKCVVVDVADKLPMLSSAYIINQYNMSHQDEENFTPATNLTDIPWGGGHSAQQKELDSQITKLALSGYCVVLIFHDEIKVLKDENKKEYEYIVPKNTFTKAGNALKDIPDFMIYLQSNGVDEDGRAILSTGYCVQHKEFFARSRFTECPDVINPFTVENLKETVKIACEKEAEKTGARAVTYEEEDKARQEAKAQKKSTVKEMQDKLAPVFKAIIDANYKKYAMGIVEQYLGVDDKGKPIKISSVKDESQVDNLQCIYDALVNFADEKNIDWEN